MGLRRLSFLVAFFAALVMATPTGIGIAHLEAKPRSANKSKSKKRANKRKRRAKKRKRRRRRYSGHGVKKEDLRTEPVPKPSGEIWIYAVNFREEIKVNIYDENGKLDEAALAQLDHGFRCKRTHEDRAVDPRLYETLSLIYDHFGKKRIELVSGFRFQKNEGSRHFHAAAMDISIEGVAIREIYEYAESLDTGGMGIGLYPRSGFVHVDWRAPGEKSYRWTDRSGPGQGNRGKSPSKAWRGRKKPNS